MKLIISKSNLSKGVQIVSKAVSTKTNMSISECILIDASEGRIRLVANDSELAIETIVEGEIIDGGIIAVPCKIFSDIIRSYNDGDITIETDDKYNTFLTYEGSEFKIIGRSADDFSDIPKVDKKEGIVLSQFTLKEIIRQTIFSISDNDTNKVMGGELFDIQGDCFKVVSLDGHRISIRKVFLKDSYENNKVIVPGKTLNELMKILSGETDKDLTLYMGDKHIVFEFDETTIVSRLIDGEYFKIDQMLSTDYETKLTVNRKIFLDCINRATLLVKEGDKKPVIITINDEVMELKINSVVGSMKEEIVITKEGKDLMIGFNPKFLIDALRVIDDEEVDLYLVNPKAPCFIRDEEQNYIYLILPVNFTTVN
ncbi:MAG: DNA polymerase III subunit beta [Lachnospiraceae bacterium]|nr:DNA polymerase III subunit beta [Lachnospiraceae bacterium]